MTEEGRGLKGFWNVKVICAVISGVALIAAALIGVAHRYLLEGVDGGQVPVPLLEEQLSDVNIYLSKTDVNRVRGGGIFEMIRRIRRWPMIVWPF